MSNSSKVSFLIAGVQKGGTTALHAYLKTHPEIFLPERKELHFFDDERNVDWEKPDYTAYHHHFSSGNLNQIWGEATPIYTFWPPALQRIHDYNPNIKLIILLRDPVERAYSHWRMEWSRDCENLSFSEAIRNGRKRMTSQDTLSRANRIYSYVERGFYYPQINRLFKLFPKEDILILWNHDLKKDHTTLLDKIYKFLGVMPPKAPPQAIFVRPVENKADIPPLSNEDKRFLRELYDEDIRKTANLLR